jgi:hypothetical protein
MKTAITQFVLGPELKKDFPEVEEAVRFRRMAARCSKTAT